MEVQGTGDFNNCIGNNVNTENNIDNMGFEGEYDDNSQTHSSKDFENMDTLAEGDGTSSSSESDDEEQEKEAELLEDKIVKNPYEYNAHVELINLLQRLGELDKLRIVRERMSNYFPLTRELWLSWLTDEITIATTDNEKKNVVNLFEKATKDYLSIELWLEYMKYCTTDGLSVCPNEFIKTVCEDAVGVAGYHITKGHAIWDAYRKYEISLLDKLMGDARNAQIDIIIQLWQRQLNIPLQSTEKTYGLFRSWVIQENLDMKAESSINSIIENSKKFMKFEQQLVSTELVDQIDVYRKYIQEVKKYDGVCICLYERAIVDSCLDFSLWIEYLEYIYHGCKELNPEFVLKTCERALRNCPWSLHLWQFYIQALEKFEKPHTTITEVMERALSSVSQTADILRSLWLSFASYMCRKVDWIGAPNDDGNVKGLEELRATFNKSCEHLAQYFGLEGDPTCEILQYWARIEAHRVHDMVRARELWNDILSQGHSETASMWLEYITLERLCGEKKRIRPMFSKALSSVEDWPESIYQAWLNYERDEGSLETYEECEAKCRKRMNVISKQRELGSSRRTDTLNRKKKPESRNQDKNRGKRKLQDKDSPVGKWANVAAAGGTHVVKPGNENKYLSEEPSRKKSKPNNDTGDSTDAHGATVVHDSSKDDRTVFVSNLAFTETEDVIRKIFSKVGTITDFRLVKDFKGRSKGFCYVEFSSPEEAVQALKKDREALNNRPIFVSKCDPDRHTRQVVFKYSTGLEKNKLFIKGLSHLTTKEDLEELFKKFGTLKDVRLVSYRNGHSKGLAYVEFQDDASATRALQETDGMTLANHTILVALSRPPDKKNTAPPVSIMSEITGRGIGMKKTPMFPRSVQMALGSSSAAASNSSVVGSQSKKALSNSDFRQFLLSKMDP